MLTAPGNQFTITRAALSTSGCAKSKCLAVIAMSLTLFVGCATHHKGAQNGNTGWSHWGKSEGGNGHWYKAVAATNSMTWTEADKLARAEGGYLATITSEAENRFVFKLVNSPEFFTAAYGDGPALGGLQQDGASEPDGGWCWVNGDPWNYTNWHPRQPDNAWNEGEDRLHYYSGIPKTPAATWNDIYRNTANLPGYIIERNH